MYGKLKIKRSKNFCIQEEDKTEEQLAMGDF